MERAVSQPNHTYLLIIVAFGSPPPAGLACAPSLSLSHRRARAPLVINAPAHRPWQSSLRSPFPRARRRARLVCQRSTSISSLGPGRPYRSSHARSGRGRGHGAVPVVGAGPPPAVAVGGRGRHLRHGAADRRARPLPPGVGTARHQGHGRRRRRQKQLARLLLLIASLCGRSLPP